jgi:hypothetical protein
MVAITEDAIGSLTTVDPTQGFPGALARAQDVPLDADPNMGDRELDNIVLTATPNQELATLILNRLSTAANHRRSIGVDDRIATAKRLRKGEFTCEELGLLGGANSAVWYPLTDGLCRTLIAFIRNVVSATNGPVWDLTDTPEPSLPDDLVTQAAEEVAAAVLSSEGIVLRDPGVLLEQVELLRENLRAAFGDLLSVRNANMKRLIADQLVDTEFESVLACVIDDFVTYPCAVIRGADIIVKDTLEWRNNKLTQEQKKQLSVTNVRPENLYPSPDSRDTDDGCYLIEVFNMSRSQLQNAKHLKGFVTEAVQAVLNHFTYHAVDWLNADSSTNFEMLDGVDDSVFDSGCTVKAVRYSGKLTGLELAKVSITKDQNRLPLEGDREYECEVWVVARFVIRVKLNTRPLFKRPYFRTSLYKKPGSFWGEAAPDRIEDFQKIANSTLRSLVRNMGWTSAPIFEIDESQFGVGVSAPSTLQPAQVLKTKSALSLNAKNALTIHQMRSFANHYLTVLAGIVDNAERAIGVPKFLAGQGAAGGAGRTLGGLLTLQGNATIGIAGSIKNLDEQLIAPLIKQMYFYNLVNGPAEVKGDAQVVATGSSVNLTRELKKDRLGEVLTVLFPFIQGQLVDPQGAIVLLRDFIEQAGINPDDVVPDPQSVITRQNEIRNALGGASGVTATAQSSA